MIKTKSHIIKILFIVFLSLMMMTGGIVFLCGEIATPPAEMEEQVDEVNAAICNIYVHFYSYGSNERGIKFEYRVTSGYSGNPMYSSNNNKDGVDVRRYSNISDPKSQRPQYQVLAAAGQLAKRFEFRSNSQGLGTNITGCTATIEGHAYNVNSMGGNYIELNAEKYHSDTNFHVNFYFDIRLPINLNKGTVNDGASYNGNSATSLYRSYLYYYCYSNTGSSVTSSYTYTPGGSSTISSSIYTGGAQTQKIEPVLPEQTVTLKPTRTGYTWKGFATTESGTTQIVDENGNWKLNRDSGDLYPRTAYAKWTANAYTITANANGGSIPSTSGWSGTGSKATKSVTFDASPGTMPKPTRTGYTFAGWYTSGATKVANADGSFVASVSGYTDANKKWKCASNATLYAHWTANKYNLKVDPVKGTYNNSTGLTSITQNYGTSYTYLTPTRTGYNFDGWHTGQNYLSSATTFNGSSTYVAIGRSAMYTDGISVAVRASMDNWAEFKTGNMRLVSCTEGGGWNFEPNGEYVQFACYDSGVGYKSAMSGIKWSELSSGYHTFVGTFDGQYATIYIDGKPYGVSAKFTSGKIGYNASNGIFIGAEAGANATSPVGNYFKGTIDYVAISNSGAVSKPASFTFPAYNSASTAQWTAKKFTLTFDGNGGGTPSPTSKTITYDNLYGELATISRAGYTFNGWFTSATGGTQITANTKVAVTADQTLYAQWTANKYDLTIKPDGGLYENNKTNKVINGACDSTIYIGKPVKTGYAFNGYSLTGGGTLSEQKASWGYNAATLKTDGNGPYYNYVMQGDRPTSNSWPSMGFPNYSFTAGQTYVLTLKIRVNSITSGDRIELRHSSVGNDWTSPMRVISAATGDWVSVQLEQVMNAEYVRAGSTLTTNPLFEIYMNSVIATGSNGSTYKVDFDMRDIVIYQKSTLATAFSSISYTYGSSAGTLMARWEIVKYKLNIDPNGGIYDSKSTVSTFTQNYYTTKPISNPGRTGYTFAGWVATKEINGATWAQILYHFNDAGSQLFASSDGLESKTKNDFYFNSQFANLARYNLTSYEFLLQYSHLSGYNQWKQTSNPATTSEAVSGYQAVSISWDTNTNSSAFQGIAKSNSGATFIDGTIGHSNWYYALGSYSEWNGGIPGPSLAEKQVTRLWLKTDPTLSNLKPTASFHNDDALGSTNYYYFKDEDITLKALWIINNYTLTANANSGSIPATTGWTGSGATATKSVAYDTAYGTLPTPSRTGYGFDGWYTAKTGGTQVSASTKMGAGNKTIYAHWTINNSTLTANCNGGTAPSTLPTGWKANGTSPYISLNYDVAYGTLPEPTRQGYIFAGWFTAASGGNEVNSTTKMGPTNTTIYAHWVESWVKYMSDDDPVIDQADGYYKIDSAAKLARLAYLVNYNIDNGKWANYQYKQTADIDLSVHYWQPIGIEGQVFGGTFDGKTFDINNLTFEIANSNIYNSNSKIGLFGYADGAQMDNVNVYNCNIKVGQYAGGIVGYSIDTYFKNCRVSGSIQATIYGEVGGIAGYITGDSEIRECENNAKVDSGASSNAGGIVGNADSGSRIIDCVNIGNISGGDQVGGIVGYAEDMTITGCVNNGYVNSDYDAGGIAGYAMSSVVLSNCVNTGVVDGLGRVGGATSCTEGNLTIEYFVNTGNLINKNSNNACSIGGILGSAEAVVTITSSFADCEISSGSTNKVGAFIGVDGDGATIKYCGARIKVTTATSKLVSLRDDESSSGICNDSYSLINNGGTQVNRITATSSGMDGKFGMVSSIHDGLPVPLGIYHVSQYGTTTGIASTLKGSKYGCTTA